MTELFEDDLLDVEEGLDNDKEIDINIESVASARQRLEKMLEEKRLQAELKDVFDF